MQNIKTFTTTNTNKHLQDVLGVYAIHAKYGRYGRKVMMARVNYLSIYHLKAANLYGWKQCTGDVPLVSVVSTLDSRYTM